MFLQFLCAHPSFPLTPRTRGPLVVYPVCRAHVKVSIRDFGHTKSVLLDHYNGRVPVRNHFQRQHSSNVYFFQITRFSHPKGKVGQNEVNTKMKGLSILRQMSVRSSSLAHFAECRVFAQSYARIKAFGARFATSCVGSMTTRPRASTRDVPKVRPIARTARGPILTRLRGVRE